MLPESMPPLRCAPTGTSLTSWRPTAWRKRRSSSSSYSSSDAVPSASSRKSKSQYCCGRAPSRSARTVRWWPGRRSRTPLEERPVGEDVLEGEVLEQVRQAEACLQRLMLEHRLDLGAEQEDGPEVGVVERLDAEAVAREEQLGRSRSQIASANMPLKRSTHAGPQAAYALSTTSVSVCERNAVARGGELVAQLGEVVDLAVVGDPVAPSLEAIGIAPAGVGSMIARRRLTSPTGPSAYWPSPSGPRWAMTSPIRRSSSGATELPERSSTPAMPHTARPPRARGQLVDDESCSSSRHPGKQREREAEPLGDDGMREVLVGQRVLVAVVAWVTGAWVPWRVATPRSSRRSISALRRS